MQSLLIRRRPLVFLVETIAVKRSDVWEKLGTRDAPFPRAHIYFRCRALLYKNWLSELVVLQRLHFLVHKCISDDTINIIECLHRSCSELTSMRAFKRAIIA